MTKIKDLKNNPDNNINMVEILQDLFPDAKSKYIELFLKLSKNLISEGHLYNDLTNSKVKVSEDQPKSIDFSKYSPIEVVATFYLFYEQVGRENISTFTKFMEFNEKGQIKNNDVTSLEKFDDLLNEVSIVEVRNISKDMKTQIVKLHDDDEWLIVKPLTVNASRKYGSNTKWCTTSLSEYSYFHNYTSRGILIYCINKQTGYKVAMYKALGKGNTELSFWNQTDSRIDSMQTELPMEIQMLLAKEVKECKITNRDLLSKEEQEKENKIFPYHQNKGGMLVEAEAPIEAAGRIRVRDAEEDLETEVPQDRMMDMREVEAPQDFPEPMTREVPMNFAHEMVNENINELMGEDDGPVWSGPYVDNDEPQRG